MVNEEYINYIRNSRKFQNLEKEGLFTKFIFFQNVKLFSLNYWIENINPNHKYYIYGKERKSNKYKKIGMVIRLTYYSYVFAILLSVYRLLCMK